MNNPENEDFMAFGEFVEEMSNLDYGLYDRFLDEDISLLADKVRIGTSCQLHIEVDENNHIKIGAIPPMYYVETTFMPVFHNITLSIEIHK